MRAQAPPRRIFFGEWVGRSEPRECRRRGPRACTSVRVAVRETRSIGESNESTKDLDATPAQSFPRDDVIICTTDSAVEFRHCSTKK
jgi:hypothetical protein